MTVKREPPRILIVLGFGLGIALAASAEETMAPTAAASPDVTVPAVNSPAPDAMAQPDLPIPEAQPAAPEPTAAPEAAVAMPAPAAPEVPAAAVEAQPAATEPSPQTVVAPGPEGAAGEVDAPFFAPPLPPRSLQSLVDERRDQLRAERNAWLGAYMPGAMPPWFADYDAGVERYRDAMRSFWRQRRDYDQLRHDSWMDAIRPWSKPQRDWSRQRSFETQMRQLDRREAMEAYRFAPPYGFGAPPLW